MTKLSEQQEKFCRNVVEGMSQADAYRAAGYKSGSDEADWSNSSRLIRNDKVAARIDVLRKAAQERTAFTAASFAKRLERLAAAAENSALRASETETGERVEMLVAKDAADVARQSIMDAAKLLGLIVDHSRTVNENFNYEVSDAPLDADEWEQEFAETDPVEATAGASARLN